jgi:glycosyltransferase involved in cell wall biosynthesis
MEVTVILPTTGDRWELVQYALDCIRRQTVTELEIFLIGDGAAERSHAMFEKWAQSDARLRYFPFEKHERRGETYRDQLLRTEAKGRIVAYCCDRDLWFPHHLATITDALRDADFAHSLVMDVQPDGTMRGRHYIDLTIPAHRAGLLHDVGATFGVPLSSSAHTLAAYKALAEGWAATPGRIVTDTNMARKWMRDPRTRVTTILRPTLLYFHRGEHPGWPVPQRRDELARWHPKTRDREGYVECLEAYSAAISRERVELFHRAQRLEARAHPLRALVKTMMNGLLRIDLATGRTLSVRFPRLRKLARAMR